MKKNAILREYMMEKWITIFCKSDSPMKEVLTWQESEELNEDEKEYLFQWENEHPI